MIRALHVHARKCCGMVTVILWLACGYEVYAQEWKAWETAADSLVQAEKYHEAIKLYTRVIESAREKTDAVYDVLYKRAVCYYSAGEPEAALQDVNTFLEAYPSVGQAIMLQAFVYKELDDVEGQLASLDKLVDLQPFNTDLLKWQASLLLEKEEYEAAQKKLKLARLYKKDPETELYLGLSHYYLDQADSALLYFDEAIALDADYFAAYLYAGLLCVDEAAYALALIYLDKAQAIDDTNLALQFYKGVALVELDRKEEGCRYLSRAFYGGLDDAGDYLAEYCFNPSLD